MAIFNHFSKNGLYDAIFCLSVIRERIVGYIREEHVGSRKIYPDTNKSIVSFISDAYRRAINAEPGMEEAVKYHRLLEYISRLKRVMEDDGCGKIVRDAVEESFYQALSSNGDGSKFELFSELYYGYAPGKDEHKLLAGVELAMRKLYQMIDTRDIASAAQAATLSQKYKGIIDRFGDLTSVIDSYEMINTVENNVSVTLNNDLPKVDLGENLIETLSNYVETLKRFIDSGIGLGNLLRVSTSDSYEFSRIRRCLTSSFNTLDKAFSKIDSETLIKDLKTIGLTEQQIENIKDSLVSNIHIPDDKFEFMLSIDRWSRFLRALHDMYIDWLVNSDQKKLESVITGKLYEKTVPSCR